MATSGSPVNTPGTEFQGAYGTARPSVCLSVRRHILETYSLKPHKRFRWSLTTTFITCHELKLVHDITKKNWGHRGSTGGCPPKYGFAFFSETTHTILVKRDHNLHDPWCTKVCSLHWKKQSIGIYSLLHEIFCRLSMPSNGSLVFLSNHYKVSTQG